MNSNALPSRFAYYITARRSNGETVYYCLLGLQPASMTPCAWSLAWRFAKQGHARATIRDARQKWAGLTGWKTNREAVAV